MKSSRCDGVCLARQDAGRRAHVAAPAGSVETNTVQPPVRTTGPLSSRDREAHGGSPGLGDTFERGVGVEGGLCRATFE